MRSWRTGIRCWLVALALASGGTVASGATTQDIHQFNISATDPTNAIHAFGKQSGMQIVASANDLRNKKFNAVRGMISTAEALNDLLAGTGLDYRYVGDNAVALMPDSGSDRLAASGVDSHSPAALKSAAAAQPAAAAQQSPPLGTGTAVTDSVQDIGQVVVTGTRFKRNGYEAPTPLTVIGSGEIQAAAPQNLANYVNTLPQLSGSITPTNNFKSISAGSTGLNVLNLRNLGTTRTLVLIDGRRWVASDVQGEIDINNIPQGLVARVDVVTGGASATYGSDAVAGVVNFILDTSFTGFKADISGGLTTYGDDPNWKVSLAGGTPFADGRGHFLIEGDIAENYGILNQPRNWALTGWKDINNPNYTPANGQPREIILPSVGMSNAAPGGMIASGPLRGIYFGPGGIPYQFRYGPIVADPFANGGDWRETSTDVYGSLDTAVYRYSLFSRGSFDLTDGLNVYAEYTHAYTESHGFDAQEYSLGGLKINTDNPFLPTSVADQARNLGLSTLNIGTTYGDLPPFGARDYRRVNRFLLGGNGRFDLFNRRYTWDFYGTLGLSDATETVNVTYNSNLANAIQAVGRPNGSISCASTLLSPDDGCVPFNLFGTGVNSQSAIDYVEGQGHLDQRFKQIAGGVNVQGEPFEDWAGPVSVALGAEARRESVDGESTAQDLAGNEFAGNFRPVIGHYEVTEGYVETDIPLVKDARFAKSLDLNAAARATNYSVSGYVTTWKLGLTYQPIPDIRFRATTSSDIRAPNLAELFTKGATAVFSAIDPLNGGQIYNNYDVTVGNEKLQPESARTTEVGFVFTPRFLTGFSGSVDFYYINIEQAIGQPTPQEEIDFCYGGVASYCDALVRGGPPGALGTNEISLVYQQSFNQAAQKEAGIDFDLSYRTPLFFPNDSLTVRALATHYMYNIVDAGIPGVSPVNLAGVNSGNGPPSWRFLSTISYTKDAIGLTLTGRAVSAGRYNNSFIECSSSCPVSTANNITIDNNHIAGTWYLDGNLSYTIKSGSGQIDLYFNVINLFNEDPPIVAPGPGGTSFNMPPYNPILYDVLGRQFRAGVRVTL